MAGASKTGLASRMRAWMREQPKAFRPSQICDGLGIGPGPERQKVRTALADFLRRGEIERRGWGKYWYNHTWRKAIESPIKQKILKAMHVSSSFTVVDIQRLTGQRDRNYIDCIVAELSRQQYICRLYQRPRPQGGTERVWYVADRKRFRLELMR